MPTQWRSANLSAIIPDGVEKLIDTIRALLNVVKAPLEITSTVLDIGKSLLVTINIDFLGALKTAVIEFERSIKATSIHSLSMWDYPARQLYMASSGNTSDYGPTNTYNRINLKGQTFEQSFLRELVYSL